MTDPITPPPELVQEWIAEARTINDDIEVSVLGHRGMDTPPCAEAWATAKLIAELRSRVEALEAARRPKSPSLKRVALLQLDTLNADLGLGGKGVDLSQIRRALEALPDD